MIICSKRIDTKLRNTLFSNTLGQHTLKLRLPGVENLDQPSGSLKNIMSSDETQIHKHGLFLVNPWAVSIKANRCISKRRCNIDNVCADLYECVNGVRMPESHLLIHIY